MQRDQLLHPHKLSAPHTRKHYTVNYMRTHTHTHTHLYTTQGHVCTKNKLHVTTLVYPQGHMCTKTNYMSPHLYKPLKGICVYKKNKLHVTKYINPVEQNTLTHSITLRIREYTHTDILTYNIQPFTSLLQFPSASSLI